VLRRGPISKEASVTRRSLLRLGILGSLGTTAVQIATVLVAYARPRAVPRVRVYAGRPSDYRLGEPVYLPEARCHISRVPEGLLAMSARCTHAGCIVPWRAGDPSEDPLGSRGRFDCPCHGTIYDRYGRVKAGPGPRPLDLLSLELDRGALVVDTRTNRRRTDFQPGQALPV
jgi:cytochrome b6-f complex iron-sulfur subunit